jgi:hypothetical protein
MASYQVSGAGSTFVNGTYAENGTYNGYPNYEYVSGGTTYKLQYPNSAIGWVLTDGNTTYYTGKGGTTPDTVTSWSVGLGIFPAPTVTKVADSSGGDTGGSAGGDSGTTTVAGYRVAGAGETAANGDYLLAGEYNGKPMYEYNSYYLRFSGTEASPGWQILNSSSTVLYFGSGLTPDVVAWYYSPTNTNLVPAPTVTVIEGAGDSGGGVVAPEDTTIIVPDSTPQVGEKGLKVGNMFIPVCPNPVDTHLSKVSDTGKNIALGWLGFGDGVDITGLDVQFQALTDGWLSAHVTATAGGQYLELLVYRGDNDSEHRYGNTRYSYSSGDLRAMMFVPRGMFYKVRSNATLVKALWLPCNGASE